MKVKRVCELSECDNLATHHIKIWTAYTKDGDKERLVEVCEEHYKMAHPSRKTTEKQDKLEG